MRIIIGDASKTLQMRHVVASVPGARLESVSVNSDSGLDDNQAEITHKKEEHETATTVANLLHVLDFQVIFTELP